MWDTVSVSLFHTESRCRMPYFVVVMKYYGLSSAYSRWAGSDSDCPPSRHHQGG